MIEGLPLWDAAPYINVLALPEDDLLRRVARQMNLQALALAVGASPRQVQRKVNELIHEHRIPIATAMGRNAGNYLAVTDHDRANAAALLRQRGLAELARASVLAGITTREEVARLQTELEVA